MLKPLEQWICDGCGQTIEVVSEGWIEWLEDAVDAHAARGFRIVHRAGAGDADKDRCQRYAVATPAGTACADESMEDFLQGGGMPKLLALLDPGEHLEDEYTGPRVQDLREWIELARRLTIPYYEEARCYWGEANSAGFFAETSESWPYLPANLQTLIKRYGNK